MTENAKRLIPFDIHCDKVLTAFSKRWNPSRARLDYEKQFSIENWRALLKKNRSIPSLIAEHAAKSYGITENISSRASFQSTVLHYTIPS